MNKEIWIPALEFCSHHDIEVSFIQSLEESGMITISTIGEIQYIQRSQLPDLEKIIRLYYDLDINMEGIETVNHLLRRISSLQDEITSLKNRLSLYESFDQDAED